MKKRRDIIFILLAAFAAWWLFSRLAGLPTFSDLFTAKKVEIDKTTIVITNIKALAQLVTISAYDEIVVDSTVNSSDGLHGFAALYPALAPAIFSADKKLVLIGKTTTHVGLDLQKLGTNDLQIISDSIHLTLPPAQVLEVILNPADVEVFEERGKWTNDAIVHLKNKITYLAAANAKSLGLLAQSETKAKEILTAFFKGLGYKKVGFSFNTQL